MSALSSYCFASAGRWRPGRCSGSVHQLGMTFAPRVILKKRAMPMRSRFEKKRGKSFIDFQEWKKDRRMCRRNADGDAWRHAPMMPVPAPVAMPCHQGPWGSGIGVLDKLQPSFRHPRATGVVWAPARRPEPREAF